jgi:hypothetical protein
MQQNGDDDRKAESDGATSIGQGAEGNQGSSASDDGPKPVPYKGSEGRDDAQHERLPPEDEPREEKDDEGRPAGKRAA